VAAIVTNARKEILLVERARHPKKGYWDLPGGFMEQGESAEDALQREIAEELGVLLGRTKYQSSYPDRYRFKNIHYHTITSVFTGTLSLTAKLVPADDVAGFRWFDPAHLPWYKIGFPSLQQALKEYCKRILHVLGKIEK